VVLADHDVLRFGAVVRTAFLGAAAFHAVAHSGLIAS
jgi:hypothetical protein